MHKIHNIIFTPISCSHGMAGTQRLNNIIYNLPSENFKVSNFIIDGGSITKFIKAVKLCVFLFKKKSNSTINILYHYSNINLQTLLPCIIAKLMGYQLIIDLVEDYTLLNKNEIYRKGKLRVFIIVLIENIYRQLVDGFVVISRHLEIKAKKIGNGKIPTAHIPVSFNPADFSNLQKKKINGLKNKFLIFYGGSFGNKDGLEYLLPAFDKIATKYSDAVLVTTGKINKNYIVNYKKQKEKMQHKDRIIDLGYVSIEKYNNIIYNSDVLCMTRKNSGYANAGFPFKLAAFLATGNPVIATEVSNITDYLTEEHCYLIKSVSVEKIYNALEKIKSNPIEAKKIGWLGKRVAHQYFNAQKHRIIFFDLIDRIS